jgi:hypothetical protein
VGAVRCTSLDHDSYARKNFNDFSYVMS